MRGGEGCATGPRRGRQWFGSLSGGHEYRERKDVLVSACARLDLMRATLNGYAESAAAREQLDLWRPGRVHDDRPAGPACADGLCARRRRASAAAASQVPTPLRGDRRGHDELHRPGPRRAGLHGDPAGRAVQPVDGRSGRQVVLRSGFALSPAYGSSLANGGAAWPRSFRTSRRRAGRACAAGASVPPSPIPAWSRRDGR